jgi:superfamily II DNA or RNA helicase
VTLRPYQNEAITAIESLWDEGFNRPVCILPVGAGKTTVFSALVGRHIERLKAQGKRILILAHREELLDQAAARVKLQNPGLWVCVVKASRGRKDQQFCDVVVASVQTLAREKRRTALDRVGLIIVDECHHAASKSYMDILRHYGAMEDGGTPVVGFTATLNRMQGGLPEVWQRVAYTKEIEWMISQGFLVPPRAYSAVVPGFSVDQARVTAGDLNTGDIATMLVKANAFSLIVQQHQAHAAGRPTVAFMPNVDTTRRMTDAFNEAGVSAEYVVGSMKSAERSAVYDRYASGQTTVLVNCMVATEGWDQPHTSCVLVGRPTINPGLMIQMVGRGLRLHPSKDDCVVLDVAGASLKHSLAGVNDLADNCTSSCRCECLLCGCSGGQCKCGMRQCGCDCVGNHECPALRVCECVGSGMCPCDCEIVPSVEEEQPCQCAVGCECFAGDVVEPEELVIDAADLLEVNILAKKVDASRHAWATTHAGIRFLPIGTETHVFLLPAPDGGFFQGRVDGMYPTAPVTRLDDGAVSVEEAVEALERVADEAGYQYGSRSASWRRKPASEAQLTILARFGSRPTEPMRKGEASDCIAAAKVSRVLDHRFGSYVNS